MLESDVVVLLELYKLGQKTVVVMSFRTGNIELARVGEGTGQCSKSPKVEVGIFVGRIDVGSVEVSTASMYCDMDGGVPSLDSGLVEDLA